MSAIPTQRDPYSVRGRIFDKATRSGIGNLVVTLYDVQGRNDSPGDAEDDGSQRLGLRVGSVLSDAAGEFALSYGEDDIGASGSEKKRRDLMLVVSAPDDDTGDSGERVIHRSSPRRNAGRIENFSIGISRATQQKFELNDSVDITQTIDSYARLRSDELELSDGVATFHQAVVAADIREKAALREDLLKVIETSPEAITTTGEIVRGGDSIKDKVALVATTAAARANGGVNTGRGVPVTLYLTPEDRDRLRPFLDAATDGFALIPEPELQGLLFDRNSTENPGTLLLHGNPIAKYCAEQTFEETCAKQHFGLGPNHSESPEHDDGDSDADDADGDADSHVDEPDPLTDTAVEERLTSLLMDVSSPESVLTPEFSGQRADQQAVEAGVRDFSLGHGPAEVPAFYDFSSLQIAFEHVWKVLLDEDVVNATYVLDKKYRSRTGFHLLDRFPVGWPKVLGDWPVYESVTQEVPAEVAAQFDITLVEWTDLSSSHQRKLQEIAVGIVAVSNPAKVGGFGGVFGTSVQVRRSDWERRRQDLREQGDRLIDAVRHDDYYTMHQTLRQLHDRINSAYEFTVFAADRNFRSVNFGLLNTFRQEWTPINYQAGQLVKTIPLSPKEERKYSLKTTRMVKQARKEALKNNASMKSEQSSTARVESEIMAKAQNKTNFALSTEGTYNIGISKGKATTTFGVEAQQESAQTRKDFREAVLKAAQEYSEERDVQIDTEETLSSEYTESGTIVNPNDELSVTYLFYELQRRYRVSEQLHQCMPVVLVAQEVPAPHEITESWVISNDWIVNRYLLDDSFRPALRYLAEKSVGDDFALRELRKNLRQQRNLVETLRIELSVASGEAENRYRSLENAIEKRIGEESAENTDGWFSDVGDFFGGGGQDPEAAKARELAAKDAHQYAVEKTEKAAVALRQEVGNLHTLTQEYNTTLHDHLDNETRVKRLLVHIRNNIFYYLQAIWSMEPPDQRFLRLHTVQVPQLDLAQVPDPNDSAALVPDRTYRVELAPRDDIFEDFRTPGTTKHRAFLTGHLDPVTKFRPLVEVADLDSLLGFKGNYMIFPLKEHNALTQFMAAPYIDSAFGAMDPDELSNVSLSEYAKYVCCLHDNLSTDEFQALEPKLRAWLELLLADPLRNGDEIVVPTNSLFIEILPGTHPLLEDFKLRHRELDVFKVASEVRKAELENLRLAARLLHAEREDPDIDKVIRVEGGAAVIVDPNS